MVDQALTNERIWDLILPLEWVHRTCTKAAGGDTSAAWLAMFLTARSWREGKGRTIGSWVGRFAPRVAFQIMRGGKDHQPGRKSADLLHYSARPHDELSLDQLAVSVDERAEYEPVEIERLRAALEVLPEREREALQLYYFEGMTWRGIARMLQIAPQSAHRLAQTGMGRLHSRLTKIQACPR